MFFGAHVISDMVNVAAASPERLSTKALAAAGQFRAIALWLNEPLIPQGIYVQVRKDKRKGCLLIVAEFERPPEPQRLTQYICHLIWQLNSPLIEGIHLMARPVGESKVSWARRVRVMTPALREQINRSQGRGSRTAPIPPQIAHKHSHQPPATKQRLFTDHIKTLRAFMLTGSAVAAFVFGCLVEVLLSTGQEPSLPFENRQAVRTDVKVEATRPLTSPQLPNLKTVLADYESESPSDNDPEAIPVVEAVVVPETLPTEATQPNRPNYVHGALEPVGVMEHGRIPNPADPTVTLVFGGDVSLDDLPYSDYAHDSELLSGVVAYQQADIAMVNLNDSLATADTSLEEKFLDRQRPYAINLLKEGGVDIVNLTSEHTLAYGEQGLTETLEVLDSSGVYRVGAGRNEREARRPEILDVKGQRIAYLSYDQAAQQLADESVAG
ncbi:MAG: CapA family protein, partial [Cyanobacteria bacterium J06636_16]